MILIRTAMIDFTIPGEPSLRDWQKTAFVVDCLRHAPSDPFNSPIRVNLKFYLNRPDDHFETRKNVPRDMLRPRSPKLHTDGPNVDKLARFVLNALGGLFWNGACVCDLHVIKRYSTNPRTEIEIMEAEE